MCQVQSVLDCFNPCTSTFQNKREGVTYSLADLFEISEVQDSMLSKEVICMCYLINEHLGVFIGRDMGVRSWLHRPRPYFLCKPCHQGCFMGSSAFPKECFLISWKVLSSIYYPQWVTSTVEVPLCSSINSLITSLLVVMVLSLTY